ncbi:phosphotransferase [Mycetocola miduiensis]|uniref:phosphotransferase n=1 Tax=Mycetocola miduiensis TaxID=995034 RepID=UPI001FECF01F|nr:phosphotransferase [Mycetocola miduiensis]
MATSAVADLQVLGAGPFGHGTTGDFDSALLRTGDDRELVVRVPANERAASEQSVELIALQAMTAGIRSRLPFEVPSVVGQGSTRGTRVVVYNYLPGYTVEASGIPAGDGVATSIGAAIAAIHALPGSFVAEVGLPHLTAADCRNEARSIIERAASTRLLPTAVRKRWTDAAGDDALWQFQPTVIHGSLGAESFVLTDHSVGSIVTGVLGWNSLRVGDPARDLHWLSGAGEAAESILAAYRSSSTRHQDRLLVQRSMLHAELELARWLLHGIDSRDQGIVDDAVGLLDGLVDHVLGDLMNPLSPQTGPIMAVSDVEDMLSRTPPSTAASGSSGIGMETDSYDRSELEAVFGHDAERLADEHPAASTGASRDSTPGASNQDAFDPDAVETGPIETVSSDRATADGATSGSAASNSSLSDIIAAKGDRGDAGYTAELDFSALEAAESGEITPLTQRRPSSSAE